MCTMSSVSDNGDAESEIHTGIQKIGSHSVNLTVSRKENKWVYKYTYMLSVGFLSLTKVFKITTDVC